MVNDSDTALLAVNLGTPDAPTAPAVRTVSIIHFAMSRSASCRMKPSPTSPVSLSASGP